MKVIITYGLMISAFLIRGGKCNAQIIDSVNSCEIDSVLAEYFLGILEQDGIKELWVNEDTVVFNCSRSFDNSKIGRLKPTETPRKKARQYQIKLSSYRPIQRGDCLGKSVVLELSKRISKNIWQLEGYFSFEICVSKGYLILALTSGPKERILYHRKI